MSVVPGATPVTIPVREPMVATAILPLDQVPPETESDNGVDKPGHTVELPVMAEGEITVTVVVI
jgi:hypothetical protein